MPPAAKLSPVDLELLESRLAEGGEPRFRADQVWEWTARGAGSYEEMTNLPGELRERMAGELPVSTLERVDEALVRDGPGKALFRTAVRAPADALLMRYPDALRRRCR